MRLTIIVPDQFCAVDGYGLSGVDMTGVADNVRVVQFDNGSGHIEYTNTPNQQIDTVAPFQDVIDRHEAMRAEIEARASDPFYGMTAQQAVAFAASKKLAALDAELAARLTAPVVVNGRTYYADSWATKTLESALAVAQALGQSDADPVRVPPPLQPGYWMTADLDASGNRVIAPMTVGDLKPVIVGLYDRNGILWGKKMIHEATIGAMVAGGATARQVAAYDITQGWGG